jgi:hypothetical protein
MNLKLLASGCGLAVMALTGCESTPPGAERGPHGTIGYNVRIEASEPGVRVDANGQYVGTTPLTLRIWGDKDGTFHDFGAYEYVIEAFPLRTNQFVQTRVFRTGKMFTPQDYIPRQIYFDMNQPPPPTPTYVPVPAPPVYYYPEPSYYYYGPRPYYGPRIYINPGLPHHQHR